MEKDGLLFENKTRYTKKEYEKFLKSYREEHQLKENLYTFGMIIFWIICMYLAFKTNEIFLGIAIIIGLIIFTLIKILKPAKDMQRAEENEKLSGNFFSIYKFYNNHLKVENAEGKAQLYYYRLYSIVETKTNYYIYVSRNSAYIVSKMSFTKGNDKDFSKFIKRKLLIKYKNRK